MPVPMKSPWKSMKPLERDRPYLVLASSIPARRLSSTGRLFRGAREVRRQLERTEGVVGFSLLARPLRKQYATLSVWVDEKALGVFAHGSPHGTLMTDLAPEMGPTTFVRWTITGSDGRPSWNDACCDACDEPAGTPPRRRRRRSITCLTVFATQIRHRTGGAIPDFPGWHEVEPDDSDILVRGTNVAFQRRRAVEQSPPRPLRAPSRR